MSDVFDLVAFEFEYRVLDLLDRAVSRFARDYPKQSVSAVAIYGEGYYGGFHVSIDTPENDAKMVAKWGPRGEPWIGQDHRGQYNNSPADFTFHAFDSWYPKGWLDRIDALTEGNGVMTLKNSRGSAIQIDLNSDGDEAINEPIFEELTTVLVKFGSQAESMAKIKAAATFRLGVRMQDSQCVNFWSPAIPSA